MTAWIAERYDSRPSSEGDDNRCDLIFVVRGTHDEAEVRSLVKANAPENYFDLSLVQIDTEPQGGDLWYATARYQLIEFPSDYEFDTSGGTQRISTSLATLQRLSAPGYVAPNYPCQSSQSNRRRFGSLLHCGSWESDCFPNRQSQ